MATTRTTSTSGAPRRRLQFGFAILSVISGLLTGAPGMSAIGGAATFLVRSSESAYGWPVKPFHREHPVRGYFGDPRTMFHGPPTRATVMHGGGSFSFHQGIDISAPNGTEVYPVRSGSVTAVSKEWVRVASDNGQTFEYWHIEPRVHVGDSVEAEQTVLGRIMRPAEHVHLTEYAGGRVVNPLMPGHIKPYTDATSPTVAGVSIRRPGSTAEVFPSFVRGRVEIDADAYDTPTMPVPGIWNGLPTTPALLTWRVDRWHGKTAIPETVTYDHRASEPGNAAFWATYTRGTYQNMAVFGPHYSYLQAGTYLFKLTPRPFDTQRLHDGVYELVVTATDARGNSSSLRQRITIHNRAGWIGS